MNAALLSSKNMCWCTPQDFFEELSREFHFDLDPAATDKSAKCAKYYTPADDVFGFGSERQKKLGDRIREISTRYNQEGQGFLLAEMAKLGFEVTADGRVLYVENSETGEVMPAKLVRGVTQ